jgi:ribonuclease Z
VRSRETWATGAAALLCALVAAAWLFQRPIGDAFYASAADNRAGPAPAPLADGLHLYLCGTGSPFPDATRAGPCAVVIAGETMLVVDIGEGAARNIQQGGLPIGDVDALLLTHFHSDHVDGIGPLMLLRWTQSAAQDPLPVLGPGGVEAVIAGFNAAYATDNGYRVAHHGAAIVPPSGAGARVLPFVLPPADGSRTNVYNRGGLVVSAFRVDHDPVSPAVGYRFDYRGRSIVISGDTAASAAVTANARGADLLLHEALQPRLVAHLTSALQRNGQPDNAQITRDILDYHATPEDAARSAEAAGVRALVLTHIVPPVPSSWLYAAFLGDAPGLFGGEITVGEDGMLFSLPVGSDAIARDTRL